MTICQRCPCPHKCLAWDVFCKWAAKEPQDKVEMMHICNRSSSEMTPGPMVLAPGVKKGCCGGVPMPS